MSRERRILIVDDEQRMATSLCALLTQCGYRCTAALSGREALEFLDREPVDVIVSDLRMPGLDGLEFIRQAHERHPRTLVIVITGHATTDSAIEAVRHGVFDYLRKPFEFDLLRMAVEKAFARIDADRFREDVAAMITHDIKIPLTSIIGFASMIHESGEGELHPRSREFAQAIHANGQKVLELIENYLTSCKIEAGTLRVLRSRINLKAALHDVVEALHVVAARRGRRILTHLDEIPEFAPLDQVLLYRVFANLLTNAIRYSRGEEPILVEARALDGEPPMLRLTLTNDMDQARPEDFAHVFERYQRSVATQSLEGVGIGLYVVKAAVQAQGGRVDVEVPDPHHVRFTAWLPLVEEGLPVEEQPWTT